MFLQIILEIPVVLAEYRLYRRFGTEEIRHPFLLALCANGFSYGTGLLLLLPLLRASEASADVIFGPPQPSAGFRERLLVLLCVAAILVVTLILLKKFWHKKR